MLIEVLIDGMTSWSHRFAYEADHLWKAQNAALIDTTNERDFIWILIDESQVGTDTTLLSVVP